MAFVQSHGPLLPVLVLLALVAVTVKPGGAAATKSPWLAQTRRSLGTVAKSGAPGSIWMVASPN